MGRGSGQSEGEYTFLPNQKQKALDFRVQGADRGHMKSPCKAGRDSTSQMSVSAPKERRKSSLSDFTKASRGEPEFRPKDREPSLFQITVEEKLKEGFQRAVEGYEHALLTQTELFWKLWRSRRKTKCCQASVGKEKSGGLEDEAVI